MVARILQITQSNRCGAAAVQDSLSFWPLPVQVLLFVSQPRRPLSSAILCNMCLDPDLLLPSSISQGVVGLHHSPKTLSYEYWLNDLSGLLNCRFLSPSALMQRMEVSLAEGGLSLTATMVACCSAILSEQLLVAKVTDLPCGRRSTVAGSAEEM